MPEPVADLIICVQQRWHGLVIKLRPRSHETLRLKPILRSVTFLGPRSASPPVSAGSLKRDASTCPEFHGASAFLPVCHVCQTSQVPDYLTLMCPSGNPQVLWLLPPLGLFCACTKKSGLRAEWGRKRRLLWRSPPPDRHRPAPAAVASRSPGSPAKADRKPGFFYWWSQAARAIALLAFSKVQS